MSQKPVLVIDVGSTKAACAVGQAHAAGLEVLGWGLRPYPAVSPTWPCDAAMAARAVEQALDDTRVRPLPDRAVVVLTHPALSHARVTAQVDLADEPVAVRHRDLVRLKTQALSQALGIDRDALCLETLGYAGNGFEGAHDPRGLAATRLSGTFQLVGMPLAVRRMVAQVLDAAGLEVERFVYSPQAVAACCVDEALRPKRILLVDIGGCGTEVAVIEQSRLVRSGSMAWGGMTVAEQVAKHCRMTLDAAVAESLEGLSSPKASVKQVIERQVGVLQQQLHKFLKDDPLPHAIIVTGRGALMDGLVESLGQMIELKAILGRSRRAQGTGDLATQVGLTPALGALELACLQKGSDPFQTKRGQTPSRLVDRLLDRTKTLLTEYF